MNSSVAQQNLLVGEVIRVDMWAVLSTVVIGVCVSLLLVKWLQQQQKHNLAPTQGPKIYPILGSSLEFLRNQDRVHDWATNYLQVVPSHTMKPMRLGTATFLLTANPSSVEHILKTNFENYPKGDWNQRMLEEFLGKGIFAVDGDLWKLQRKIASHEFTARSLRDYILEKVRTEASTRLLPILSRACDSGTRVDIQDIFVRFAFDNICQFTFGVDPAFLDYSLPEAKVARAFSVATDCCMERFRTIPNFVWKLKRLLNVGFEKELRIAVGVINEFAMSVVQVRKKELALGLSIHGDADLLSRFLILAAQEKLETGRLNETSANDGKNEVYTDVFLRDIVVSVLLAGKDTTSAALSWFFWLLSCNPGVEQKIYEELAKIMQSRETSATPKRGPTMKNSNISQDTVSDGCEKVSFTFEELRSMHYLHASLTESMRLYPPVPITMKMAKKDDVWPDGTVVSKDTIVGYHPYAMGRIADLWGPDCMEFKPERWIKDGNFVPASSFKYTVFQAGPRICLGKDMAMIQMKLIAAAIIQMFTLSVARDYKVEYHVSVTMHVKNGLPVALQRRPTSTCVSSALFPNCQSSSHN